MINVRLSPYNATGLGVVDDGSAINAALADALATQDSVWMPAGRYRCVTKIALANGGADAGVRLFGDGNSTVVIPACPDWQGMAFTNLYDVEVSDLRFDGESGTAPCVDLYCVVGVSSGLRLRNVRFDNIRTQRNSVNPIEAVIANGDGYLELDNVRVGSSCDVGRFPGHAYVASIKVTYGFRGFRCDGLWLQEQFPGGQNAGHALYFGEPTSHALGELVGASFDGPGVMSCGYDTNAATGLRVKARRFITDGGSVEMRRVRSMGQVAQEVIRFVPGAGRYASVHMEDCMIASSDFSEASNILIEQADRACLERVWSGIGGAFQSVPAVDFKDAGHVVLNGCDFDGDDAYRPPVTGHTVIRADAATKRLLIKDCRYSAVDADCPTWLEDGGDCWRLRRAVGSVTVGEFVQDVDGAVEWTSDQASAIGVALDATEPARGVILFDGSLNLTEGDHFPLNDGVNPVKTVTITLSGAPGAVSLSNGMSADERASTVAAFINLMHNSTFRIGATASAGGRVDLTHDDHGQIGNCSTPWQGNTVAGNQSFVPGAVRVFGMAGGRDMVRVVSQ